MSYYLQNELEIKSYDTLFKIAEKEKLVDVYSNDMTKKELIDLILYYRGLENQFFINQIIEHGFIRIQEFIDNNVNFHKYFENDIDISHKICFYENIKIKKEDKNTILINKNIDICENIVLLVGNNNYIYSILYLEKDYDFKNEKYNKYYICSNNITRYISNNIENEVVKLLFFNKYATKIIFELYNNLEIDIKPKNITGYEVIISEFSFIPIKTNNEAIPIVFMDNKIICDYFSLEFEMYVYKIKEDEIEILYFQDAKNLLEKYEYRILGTHIYSMNELFSNSDEIIRIFDNFGRNKYLSKNTLISFFIEKLKEEINYYSKKHYLRYNIIGKNIKYKDIECFSSLHFINYWVVLQNIDKVKHGIYSFEKYLIINSNLECIEASTNNYEIIEKDINYEIYVNSNLCNLKNNINYDLIINKIFLILKHKICDEKYIKYDSKELFQIIDNGNYQKINDDLKSKINILEEKFPTDYLKNKNKLTKEYMEIYQNYILIRNLAQTIYKEYLNDEYKNVYEYDFEIKKYSKLKKIVLSRDEVDYIFIIEIYNFLNIFFNFENLADILNKYNGITLMGSIIKSRIFYDILKEFIPGKLISFDLKNKKSELQLLETAKRYIEDINFGKIKYNFSLEYEKLNFIISVKNFKGKFELVYDSKTSKIGYIDKISISKKVEIKIKNEKSKDEKILEINVPEKYNEIDENYVNIEQKYLNTIENGISRIFFKYEKSLEITFINRVKDQIFVADTLIFDIV